MKNAFKIYPAELEAGLGEALANQRTVAFEQELRGKNTEKYVLALEQAIAASLANEEDRNTFDLYPCQTIMVSIGWNGNDDIFDRQETWAARHSPVNKPFNVGHKPRAVIGHIVSCVGMNEDYSIIPDNTSLDQLPDKFHLATGAVIYRFPFNKRDPELPKEMEEIIAGIERGDWFVSMECLFGGFDYGFRNSEGSLEQVVRREESTAFLTKHLRMYGGSGQYNGRKVGRVLKDITFSGKGLVEKPANKESIFIFNNVTAFAGAVASQEEVNQLIQINDKDKSTMSDESKVEIVDLKRQLAEAHQKLREMGEAEVNAKFAAKDAEIKSRDEQIAALTKQVEEVSASKVKTEESLKSIEVAKAEVDGKLGEATAKLAEIEATNKKVGRISTLVDKGVEKAEAEKIVEKFVDVDDEKFGVVVAMQADLVEAKKTQTQAAAKPEDKPAEQAAASEAKTEEVEEESTAEEQALEKAEEEVDPALAAPSETVAAQKQESQAKLSGFLGGYLAKGRKKS